MRVTTSAEPTGGAQSALSPAQRKDQASSLVENAPQLPAKVKVRVADGHTIACAGKVYEAGETFTAPPASVEGAVNRGGTDAATDHRPGDAVTALHCSRCGRLAPIEPGADPNIPAKGWVPDPDAINGAVCAEHATPREIVAYMEDVGLCAATFDDLAGPRA